MFASDIMVFCTEDGIADGGRNRSKRDLSRRALIQNVPIEIFCVMRPVDVGDGNKRQLVVCGLDVSDHVSRELHKHIVFYFDRFFFRKKQPSLVKKKEKEKKI